MRVNDPATSEWNAIFDRKGSRTLWGTRLPATGQYGGGAFNARHRGRGALIPDTEHIDIQLPFVFIFKPNVALLLITTTIAGKEGFFCGRTSSEAS